MLAHYFQIYPKDKAPFMHKMLAECLATRPFAGLKILHHMPVVPNTLLKIACLVAAGADVTVTNPSFMSARFEAVAALQNEGIRYVDDLAKLKSEQFDIHFDCGAELYQHLLAPKIGAIELTGSGDHYYRSQNLLFPVISIDKTRTKQLETILGTALGGVLGLSQWLPIDLANKKWLIFGFGKIGRGLAYYCINHYIEFTVAEACPKTRDTAQSLGVKVIDPNEQEVLKQCLLKTNLVITATGKASVLDAYPKEWFRGKILANMGVVDEFGSNFSIDEVLNKKVPVNFVLPDPTPIIYIDPIFYAHNLAGLELLRSHLPNCVTNLSKNVDCAIINAWVQFHGMSLGELEGWFI